MGTRPLVVTADLQLLDDVLRVAAVAGVEIDHRVDPAAARGDWTSAPVVVIGADAAGDCARLRFSRRPRVVLLARGCEDATAWQHAVGIGAEHVLFLPDAEGFLGDFLADAGEPTSAGATVVAVIGGRGGAGATTLACALAVTAARREHRVVLIDGDPLGGGLDLVFGGERAEGLRWADLEGVRGRLPAESLAAELPHLSGVSVLSWGRPGGGSAEPATVAPAAMDAVLSAGRRAADLVVVDLPRCLDDTFRLVANESDVALLVVPAEIRAAAAAARVAAALQASSSELRLIVRGPAPAGLPPVEVAIALSLPLSHHLRPEAGLDADLERGVPPAQSTRSPLRQLCDGLIGDLLAGRPAA